MLSQDKINRINELARKAKGEGLSKNEEKEQQKLRSDYIKSFRKSFKGTLHNVKVVDEKGQDVTPKKLKESKSKMSDRNFLN